MKFSRRLLFLDVFSLTNISLRTDLNKKLVASFFVFLSKHDTMSVGEVKKKIDKLKKLNKNVGVLSVHDFDSIEKIKKILNKIKKEK